MPPLDDTEFQYPTPDADTGNMAIGGAVSPPPPISWAPSALTTPPPQQDVAPPPDTTPPPPPVDTTPPPPMLPDAGGPEDVTQTAPMRVRGSRGGASALSGNDYVDHEPRLKAPFARYKQLEQDQPTLYAAINHIADDVGVPRADLAALIYANSDDDPNAKSGNRIGYMGITPADQAKYDPEGHLDPNHPLDNIWLGAKKYLDLAHENGFFTPETLAAYHSGESVVNSLHRHNKSDHQSIAPPGMFDFVNKVVGREQPSAAIDMGAERGPGPPTIQPSAFGGNIPSQTSQAKGALALPDMGIEQMMPPTDAMAGRPAQIPVNPNLLIAEQRGVPTTIPPPAPYQAAPGYETDTGGFPSSRDTDETRLARGQPLSRTLGAPSYNAPEQPPPVTGYDRPLAKVALDPQTWRDVGGVLKRTFDRPAVTPYNPYADVKPQGAEPTDFTSRTLEPMSAGTTIPSAPAASAPPAAPATPATPTTPPAALAPAQFGTGLRNIVPATAPAAPAPGAATAPTTGSEPPPKPTVTPEDRPPSAGAAPPQAGTPGGAPLVSQPAPQTVGATPPARPTTRDGPITSLPGGPSRMTPQGAVQAAATGGPNGVLTYMSDNGRAGATPGQNWNSFQRNLMGVAAMGGSVDDIIHAHQYVFTLQHAGAVQNLQAAWAAFDTDKQTAASLLARSHAFFNDGSVGGFQVVNNQIVGQRFDENTHQPLGSPFAVTKQGILDMAKQIQDPARFQQLVDEEKKTNETIAHNIQDEEHNRVTAAETEKYHAAEIDVRKKEADARLAEFHERQAGEDRRQQERLDAAAARQRYAIENKANAQREQIVKSARDGANEMFGPTGSKDGPIDDPPDIDGNPMTGKPRNDAATLFANIAQFNQGLMKGSIADMVRSLVAPTDPNGALHSLTQFKMRPAINPSTGKQQVDKDGVPWVGVYDRNGVGVAYLPQSALEGLGVPMSSAQPQVQLRPAADTTGR